VGWAFADWFGGGFGVSWGFFTEAFPSPPLFLLLKLLQHFFYTKKY
jgi:hypothetical protein